MLYKRPAEDELEKEGKGKKARSSINIEQSEPEIPVELINSSQKSQVSSVPFLDVAYDDSEYDSTYRDSQSLKESESSSYSIKGYIWTLTLSELDIVFFGKKEMTTTNLLIKTKYDNTHIEAMNKTIKPTDMDRRLSLSALFDCFKPTKVLEQYVGPVSKLPHSIISCIKAMEKSMDNDEVMEIGGDKIIKCMAFENVGGAMPIFSFAFGSVFVGHAVLNWVFHIVAHLDELYTGILRLGAINTPKASVDLARTRVLETCKRQLHLMLKVAKSLKEAVLIIVCAQPFTGDFWCLSYKLYMVTFNDGYYPYERISVGLMPTSFATFKCTEKMLMDLCQLKKSINLSLRLESTNAAILFQGLAHSADELLHTP
ncbi:uncharacterized protein EV154DRAFT_563888 [Mucor mucedo]|uniref:uncharacterized protein n=1 Tax=Mucor mucedo TaxID=29922 RepID=UPI00221F936E|nr:uncharacterized protein EV154DRAFT_563888 [Mucor mucedo]KAI7890947.1 hypothetical protein EV154DRAFT_563888 [Mucor mucedo]